MKTLPTAALVLFSTIAVAHEQSAKEAHQVVPDSERSAAIGVRATGPRENSGVQSVQTLGEQSISGEAWVRDQRKMRVREITIAPGGVVAVHEHQGRPGMAYILEGSILEHRNDAPEPIERNTGAVSFEKSGVIHWWENTGEDSVRALVVDLVPEEPAKEKE